MPTPSIHPPTPINDAFVFHERPGGSCLISISMTGTALERSFLFFSRFVVFQRAEQRTAERYCRVGSDKEALKDDGGSERERGERKKRRTAARSPEGREKKETAGTGSG